MNRKKLVVSAIDVFSLVLLGLLLSDNMKYENILAKTAWLMADNRVGDMRTAEEAIRQ